MQYAWQVLQDIRGTQDVDEEFTDICEACIESNKVPSALLITTAVTAVQASILVIEEQWLLALHEHIDVNCLYT